jgi:hypothetical protein
MQQRILVTGATGKVSQTFIKHLFKDARFDSFIVRGLCHNRILDAGERLEVVRGSIQDLETTSGILESSGIPSLETARSSLFTGYTHKNCTWYVTDNVSNLL